MFSNQSAQASFLAKKSSQENTPSWRSFCLKEFEKKVNYYAGIVMDDYLVVLAGNGAVSSQDHSTSLLALNLRKSTVKETDLLIGSFSNKKDYSFLKYDGNKIIKYGGDDSISMTCITIISFEPLKVECETIEDQNQGRFSQHAAQIYQDCLYVYGKTESKENPKLPRYELRSFDLKKRIWKLCETTGGAPEFDSSSKSFIYEDNLCVYGVRERGKRQGESEYACKDLFMLNLNENFAIDDMEWIRIEQEKIYLECWDSGPKIEGPIYKDHLVVFSRHNSLPQKILCFFNLQTKDTWSTFNIKGMQLDTTSKVRVNNLIISKNSVLYLTSRDDDTKIIVNILNLETSGISSELDEEQKESYLFLNQAESDITFKVGDQLIPAHKRILMEKSRYFKNGLNSSQEIIEIEDYECEIFKEYLRWIYQKALNRKLKDIYQPFKLYILAEKYSQEDLRERCFKFCKRLINKNNISEILVFIYEKNTPELKDWCTQFFKDHCNENKVIEYLDRGFKERTKELRDFVFSVVFEKLLDSCRPWVWAEKKSTQIYQDFLIKNIQMDNVSALAKFVSQSEERSENGKRDPFVEKDQYEYDFFKETTSKAKTLFEERITQLKKAIFSFLHENVKTILTSEISKDFVRDLTFGSLFMSQIESDIAFKIEEKVIPAHKMILMKKSRYFAGVFKSDMAESRQNLIEITDCEYEVFKEYLRFIYQGVVRLRNENQIIKLYFLADKYLQEDLGEKCLNLLSKNIKKENVYKILDFAHEQNLQSVRDSCLKFFQWYLDINNMNELIEYLGRQEDRELTTFAFNFVLENFFEIDEKKKESLQVCEDFVMKNIEMDTLSSLVRFLNCSYKLPERKKPIEKEDSVEEEDKDSDKEEDDEEEDEEDEEENEEDSNEEDSDKEDSDEEDEVKSSKSENEHYILNVKMLPSTKDLFDEKTIMLKGTAFSFIHGNAQIVMTSEISRYFKTGFWRDLTLYLAGNTSNQVAEEIKGNEKKRMEPVQDDTDEGNPTLKKTKKSDPGN